MGAGARRAGSKSDLSPTEATPRSITVGLADTRRESESAAEYGEAFGHVIKPAVCGSSLASATVKRALVTNTVL
jgi:hypothetical protein